MRLKHKVPAVGIRSDPITPEYQAQVDRATNKAMVAYERAKRHLAAAEERAERAQAKKDRAKDKRAAKAAEHQLLVALELVELRREELRRIEAMMKSSPGGAEHRGRRSFRPVPTPGSTL